MAQQKRWVYLKNILLTGLIWLFFALALGLAMAIPFLYPTQTLWYKIGSDKVLLQAGHVAGLLALVLLFSQLFLGLRPQPLLATMGIGRVMRLHRANGVLLLGLALAHVGLVILPEGLANLPVGWKYWPELIGAILLGCLAITVLTAKFRDALHLPYRFWRGLHKMGAYLMFLLALAHVLFVSDAFHSGVLQKGLLVCGLVIAVIIGVMKGNRRAAGK